MRTLRTILTLALLGTASNALTSAAALAQDCACPVAADESGATSVRVFADEAPPPLPEYQQPPLPAAGYIWTPGYWAWNNDDYYWVPGTWVAPPRPGLLWTPGYWAFVNNVYAFHRGYWGQHVGFYGGVSYGFGYNGAGFEGGEWRDDHFFYNRAVNNIHNVNITNVYNKTVIINNEAPRTSFNGGAEGVKAKPTAEELAAAKETHVPATAEQRHNRAAASHSEAAFVSNNKGKPAVAATAKPGVLKGPGVTAAKAAGGPIKPRATEEPAKTEPEKAATPEPKAETPKMEKPAVKAATPEPKAETPKAETPKTETPKAAEPEKAKPEPKTEREKVKPEEKADKPKAEHEKAKPEPKADKPKTEREKTKPEEKADKPKAELEKAKPEPKAEKPRAEAAKVRPEPKVEKPRTEAEKAKPEPKAEKPKAEAERPKPQRAAEARVCHPGAPNCPK